jgi:putative transposase
MTRREIPGGVRFITFSCQRRLPLLSHPLAADTFAQSLDGARRRLGFELFAWVVMPEHIHLLVRPPHGVPLDRVLLSIKLGVATRVLAQWKSVGAPMLRDITRADRTPRFWQKGGGFDRNVRDTGEFMKDVHYIHRNPVERGLAERPEDWRWSSVRWWMGRRDGELECDPPPTRSIDWSGWRGYM